MNYDDNTNTQRVNLNLNSFKEELWNFYMK